MKLLIVIIIIPALLSQNPEQLSSNKNITIDSSNNTNKTFETNKTLNEPFLKDNSSDVANKPNYTSSDQVFLYTTDQLDIVSIVLIAIAAVLVILIIILLIIYWLRKRKLASDDKKTKEITRIKAQNFAKRNTNNNIEEITLPQQPGEGKIFVRNQSKRNTTKMSNLGISQNFLNSNKIEEKSKEISVSINKQEKQKDNKKDITMSERNLLAESHREDDFDNSKISGMIINGSPNVLGFNPSVKEQNSAENEFQMKLQRIDTKNSEKIMEIAKKMEPDTTNVAEKYHTNKEAGVNFDNFSDGNRSDYYSSSEEENKNDSDNDFNDIDIDNDNDNDNNKDNDFVNNHYNNNDNDNDNNDDYYDLDRDRSDEFNLHLFGDGKSSYNHNHDHIEKHYANNADHVSDLDIEFTKNNFYSNHPSSLNNVDFRQSISKLSAINPQYMKKFKSNEIHENEENNGSFLND